MVAVPLLAEGETETGLGEVLSDQTAYEEAVRATRPIVNALAEIRPILAGMSQQHIGPLLADLVARFMVSYPPQNREAALELHLHSVRVLLSALDGDRKYGL